jgi:CRP-like cAMP-binding protein
MNRTEQAERAANAYPFLANLELEHRKKLWAIAEERDFRRDEIIFREGAKSEYFFLIGSGSIALEIVGAGRGIVIQTLGPGDAMGWSALTETAKTHFQARALSDVQAVAFDRAKLSVTFEYDHSLGYEMMKKLLALVTERLDHTRMQILDMYGKQGAVRR